MGRSNAARRLEPVGDGDDDNNNSGGGGGAPEEGGKRVSVPSPEDSKILEEIEAASRELDALDQQASEINAKRKEIRERMESKGINRWAFAYARQVVGMKDTKREGMDLSYLLCRQALKDPVQTDWIEDPQD